MKLWEKVVKVNNLLEKFSIGEDAELDLRLAPYDVLGSMAHAKMLYTQGLISGNDYMALQKGLHAVYEDIETGKFTIAPGVEDVHSEVELRLTEMIGDAGKRIHTARSRNDQVLLDMRLYLRHETAGIAGDVQQLFAVLMEQARKHEKVLMPGYTHMQVAMPSSFGLWFSAYAESLADDMEMLQAAYRVLDKNPLGSAAGYGSSFNINRQQTTELLGFSAMDVNVVYAQMGRGKTERFMAMAISAIAGTLNKLAMDYCLFSNENYGFIKLPDAYTTGSSIMPHKKNPDGWELIRGNCSRLAALPNEINMVCNNLPLGYNREMQLLKGSILRGVDTLRDCLQLAAEMINVTQVNEHILQDERYKYLFSVEEVNRLVMHGLPFRDAYKKIGDDIAQGSYTYSTEVQHTHEGSIGSPGYDAIEQRMQHMMAGFNFSRAAEALEKLAAI